MTQPDLLERLAERLRTYRPTNEWGDGIHHDICTEAADTIEALTAERDRLREAATACRDQFAFYAREHLAAGKVEKAATNQSFADLVSAAINGEPS